MWVNISVDVAEVYEELSEDTLITVVDCHI